MAEIRTILFFQIMGYVLHILIAVMDKWIAEVLFMLILLQWIKKAEFELGILSHQFSTRAAPIFCQQIFLKNRRLKAKSKILEK